MKHLLVSVVAGLALVVAGCGGNGSDHKSSGDSTADIGTPRIEAVVSVSRTNLIEPTKYTDEQLLDPTVVNPADLIDPTIYGIQDPLNFQTSESFQFQLVGYTASGTRVVLPASFTSEDTDNLYGNLGDSGKFQASTRASYPTQISISAVANGGARYTSKYQVKERQARVLGHVYVENSARTPFDGAVLQFFDSTNNLIATVKSGSDGSYRASLPLGAVTMTVSASDLSNNFYRSFVVDGLRYDAGLSTCRVPIARLENGGDLFVGTQSFKDVYITPVKAGESTPSATGCTG